MQKNLYTLVYLGILVIHMSDTTIKIHLETKNVLDTLREYKNESYDEVIRKMLYIVKKCKKEPMLSKAAVEAIEKARDRMKKGDYLTSKEARKRLGFTN